MTRVLAALLAALALAGCGGGSSAENVLSETAANLEKIRSADLRFRLVVESGGKEAGFELVGPFALARDGALPVAELAYTQIAGSERATATFISTGRQAFVRLGDATYVLPEEQVRELRGGGLEAGDGGLAELEIGDWLVGPKLSDGGEVGGAESDRIRAQLDAVAAGNDLLSLARSLGAGVPSDLAGKSADQLRGAVRSAEIDVFTGKEDRLLRRLVIDADLAADVPAELRSALGDLASAHFRLELELGSPNREVSVEPPSGAKPWPRG